MRSISSRSLKPTTRAVSTRAALFALLAASAGAHAQLVSHWTSPVNGSFDDPTLWTGPVPTSPGVDCIFDVPGPTPYFVGIGHALTANNVTLNDPHAVLIFSSGNNAAFVATLTGNLNVQQGQVQLGSYPGGFTTPRIVVAPQASFQIITLGLLDPLPSPTMGFSSLSGRIDTYSGSRAQFTSSFDLDANAVINIDNSAITFTGTQITGTGRIEFTGTSASFSKPSGTMTIASGVTIAISTKTPGAGGSIGYAENFGRIENYVQNASIGFNGVNHGIIDITSGLNFAGINDVEGTVSVTGSATLRGLDNRGSFIVKNGTVVLSSHVTNSGVLQLQNTQLILSGTNWTPADFTPFQLLGASRIIVNTDQIVDATDPAAPAQRGTFDLDAIGNISLTGGTFSNARIIGDGSHLLYTDGTLSNVDIVSTVSFTGNNSLRINGPLNVTGLLAISRSGTVFPAADQTITGTGTISLANAGALTPPASKTLTIAPTLTVRATEGVGSIARGSGLIANVINLGTLSVATGATLVLAGSNWQNAGLISLDPGSQLLLAGAWQPSAVGNLQRNGATVIVGETRNITGTTFDLNNFPALGPVDLSSSAYTGGTLVATGRVVKVVDVNSTFRGLKLTGTTLALDLDLLGSSALTGGTSLALSNAHIRLLGPTASLTATALTGTGTISFNGTASTRKIITNAIPAGITIETLTGTSDLASTSSDFTLANSGVINVATSPLRISSRFSNAGVMDVTNTFFKVADDFTNTAAGTVTIHSGATLSITSAPVRNNGTFIIQPGAHLTIGNGSPISGTSPIEMHGLLDFASTALNTFITPPHLSSTSTIAFLASNPTFDHVAFSGALTAAGTIQVNSTAKILPGTAYQILTATSITGQFNPTVTGTANIAYLLTLLPTPTAVSVRFDPRYQGDATLNGTVDGADLDALKNTFGKTSSTYNWFSGDFTGDHIVDLADLTIVSQNWTSTPEDWTASLTRNNLPSIPLYVPQPTALTPFVFASLLTRRRRNI